MRLKNTAGRLEAGRFGRRVRRVLFVAVAATVFGTATASAEPEGAYCSKFAFYGDECVGANHNLTRSSTYNGGSLYVSAGAYQPCCGTPYASLVYGTGYACHPYGGGTYLAGRSRNSDTGQNGNISGSQYWLGTSC
jgi:hypothetical protein